MCRKVLNELARALTIAGLCIAATGTSAAPVQCDLDIDGNGIVDALTDGMLLMRAAHGIGGVDLIADAIGDGATRTHPAEILAHIGAHAELYDIDGDGVFDAPTDALMIVRHLFGFSETTVTFGALRGDSPRRNWQVLRMHLERCFAAPES